MKLTEQDKDKILELVNCGFGSRKIAKELGYKVSFQAISIHAKRVKEKQLKAGLDAKLNQILLTLANIEHYLGIIPSMPSGSKLLGKTFYKDLVSSSDIKNTWQK